MKTIRRNARVQIEKIFEAGYDGKCLCLANNFKGMETDIDWIKGQYESNKRARMTTDGFGKYTVTIHSNCWFEFFATV